MTAGLRALMREPLLHFLLAGAALFLLYDAASGPGAPDDGEIVVSAGQIEHIKSIFAKTWRRQPTEMELRGLIDSFILEEVLYREAKAIGLDQDDTIIRRRLKQKMEFLVDDFSAAEPSDDVLLAYLDDHPETFRSDTRLSFEHVYFADPEVELAAILSGLRDGSLDPGAIPGASSLLPPRYAATSRSEIAGQYGEAFANRVLELAPGDWSGPVKSPYGEHLVRVGWRRDGEIPALADIRDVVKREWLRERREAVQEQFFDDLRSKYAIRIEAGEPAPPE